MWKRTFLKNQQVLTHVSRIEDFLASCFFFIKGEEAGKTICVLRIPLTNASLEVLSHEPCSKLSCMVYGGGGALKQNMIPSSGSTMVTWEYQPLRLAGIILSWCKVYPMFHGFSWKRIGDALKNDTLRPGWPLVGDVLGLMRHMKFNDLTTWVRSKASPKSMWTQKTGLKWFCTFQSEFAPCLNDFWQELGRWRVQW